MKIVIITVYNSHNCGSFLQAYALSSVLQGLGHEVAFLKRDIKGSSHDIIVVLKKFFRSLVLFKFKDAISFIRQWFTYENAQKYFRIVSLDSDFFKNSECVILGSDTIWNFDSDYFRKNASTYLGSAFKDKHVVSYAASVGNTSFSQFEEIIRQYDGLSNVDTILVRDFTTKMVVERIINRKAYIVSDPTLIAEKECYCIFKKKQDIRFSFILLYYFGEIPYGLMQQIKKYADENKLFVVSMPINRSWCYKSVNTSPVNMITYFSSADAVLTNTFHGTALSMIYEKPFAVHDVGKKKVSELLDLYGESFRLFSNESKMSVILSTNTKVVSIGKADAIKKDSLSKLLMALSLNSDI